MADTNVATTPADEPKASPKVLSLRKQAKRARKQQTPPTRERLLRPNKPRPLIISNLPPTLSQKRFLKLLQPMPAYEYCRYEVSNADPMKRPTCRACIRFKTLNDVYLFRERFDDHCFIDARGNEFRVNIEFAPYQLPKNRHGDLTEHGEQLKREPIYQRFLNALAKERAAARKLRARKAETPAENANTKPAGPTKPTTGVTPANVHKPLGRLVREALATVEPLVKHNHMSRLPLGEAKSNNEQPTRGNKKGGHRRLSGGHGIGKRNLGKTAACLENIAYDIKHLTNVIEHQMHVLQRKSQLLEVNKVKDNKPNACESPVSIPPVMSKSVPIYKERRDTVAWYLKKCC